MTTGAGSPSSPRPGGPRPARDATDAERLRSYGAIALVSCAVLLYEIAITRVLSVVLWYHFAFLSISLAMLALGVPGVWYSLRPPGAASLRRSLLASGALVPLSIVAIFKVGYHLFTRGPGMSQGAPTALVGFIVVCVLAPLTCLGSAVCLLLLQARGREIGRMYGSDLLGATVGALVVVPLMTVVPTPLILAGTGLLPLAALALLETSAARVAVALSLAIVNSMIWGTPYLLHYSKSYLEKSELLFERWTPTARLTILDQRDPTAFGWGMGSRYVPSPLEQIWVQQDGSAGTPVTRLRDAPDDLGHLFFDVTSVGYQLEPPKEVCIIGAGGGRDVLTALHARADRVDAVELNPAIVAALSGPFKDFTGDVYHRAGVNAVISEGRSFLTRSPERYDLIQVSLIDTWAATSAGAFALSENYLYTEEALRLYWERLSDSGLVSISRWMSGMRQLESLRLAILAKTALEHEGVSDASAHLAMVQAGKVGTLLVSKRPFDAERLARLDAIDRERGFVRHWPVAPETPADSSLAKVMSGGWEFLRADGLDLQAPTDDKPFFFQTASILARPGALGSATGNEQSVVLLRCLLVLMAALTVVTYFAPFALSGRLARHPGFWRGSVYFVLIGLAFMCVEAPLIQRFILYLGHPSYATTVVLATLLLGAGLGSTRAARAPVGRVASFVLPLGVVLVDVGLEAVFTGTLGWDLAARVGVSVLALAPLGFLMGFAFPLGMIRFGDGNRAWFWAMNGTVSVLASVSSLALAMVFGFSGVILVGAALYASACVVLPDIGPGSKVPPASSV